MVYGILNQFKMVKYTLYEGEIEGEYKNVTIYPMITSPGVYLIQWNGLKIGKIKKTDNKWHTETEQLVPVIGELGKFIDNNDDI